jgi:hypothetical protein
MIVCLSHFESLAVMVICDHDMAARLLPSTAGFFVFGAVFQCETQH